MMKYFKFAAYTLAAVLIVIGAVLAYIAATFDPNDYKGEITRLAREKTGRTLTIAGDLRLTFFPQLGVSLGKASLSEADGAQEFAGVDDLRLSLALLPLLSKRIVVDEVAIDGLRAHLIKRRDGSLNIDGLLAAGEPSQSAPSKAAGARGAPMALDIEGVRIRRAAFVWKDEAAGSEYTVSDLSLTTGRVAPGVPSKIEFGATVRGNRPKLELRTTLRGTLDADLDQQIFKLAGLQAEASGAAAGISELAATLHGDVEARVRQQRFAVRTIRFDASGSMGSDRLVAKVEAPVAALDGGALSVEALVAALSGRLAGIDLSQSRLAAPKLSMDLERRLLEVEGLEVSANGKRNADAISLKLDAPQLSITPEKAIGAAVVAVLKAQGPQLAADARAKLSTIEGSAKALRVGEFALEVDAKQAHNALKGTIASPVRANLESQVFEFPKIGGKFDLHSPSLPAKLATLAFSGNATADLKREAVNAQLKAMLDESNIRAKLAMTPFARSHYRFDVAIDKLNADRYMPPKKDKPAAKSADGEKVATPFDLSVLKGLNLDGSVRIGELVASNVKASNVRIDVQAANGTIAVDPLSANLYQGSVNSVVGIDANQNRYAVKQTLTGVVIGPLMRDALSRDLLEGRGDIGLDITAAGTTVNALLGTLTGSARLGLKDGAIKGINLAQSLRGAKNLLAARSVQESAAVANEKTDFSELAASFTIKDGKAHNDDLSMKSPFLRLTGAGDIDLAQAGLNYVANLSVVATSTGQGGKDLADVAGLTIPLRVSGPIGALRYKLDFSSAIADRSKQIIEEKKEEVKSRLEQQLQDKLLGAPKPAVPAAPQAEAQPGQDTAQETPSAPKPQDKPQDEVKKRLKDLFR